MVKNGGGENGMIFPGGENGISLLVNLKLIYDSRCQKTFGNEPN